MIYTLDQFLFPRECDAIKALFPAAGQGTIVGSGVDERRRSRTSFLPEDTQEQKAVRNRLLAACMRASVATSLLFDISSVEPPQLAEYATGDKYDWHLDYGPGHAAFRKLSVSVQLSDPKDYEGGELEMWPSTVAPRGQGALIVFPSFLPHRVRPVTRGVRYSLVAWAVGRTPYR